MPTRTFIQPTVGTGLSCIFEMVNKSADEWSKILVPSHLRWRGWFLRAADQWVAFLRSHGLWQTMTNLYRYAWPQPAEPHPAKVVWSILKQCLNTLRLSSLSFSSLSLYNLYICVCGSSLGMWPNLIYNACSIMIDAIFRTNTRHPFYPSIARTCAYNY